MKMIEESIKGHASALVKAVTSTGNIERIESQLRARARQFALYDAQPFSDFEDGKGIYLFEAKFPFTTLNELNAFGEKWGRVRGAPNTLKSGRYSDVRAKRFVAALRSREFIPFYLGIRQKVVSRMDEHLTDAKESTTYGLKLRARADILNGVEWRVSAVTFDITNDEYFCLKLLENQLRKKLHPIIGKQ